MARDFNAEAAEQIAAEESQRVKALIASREAKLRHDAERAETRQRLCRRHGLDPAKTPMVNDSRVPGSPPLAKAERLYAAAWGSFVGSWCGGHSGKISEILNPESARAGQIWGAPPPSDEDHERLRATRRAERARRSRSRGRRPILPSASPAPMAPKRTTVMGGGSRMSEHDDYIASLPPTDRGAVDLSAALAKPENADLVKKLMEGDKEARAQFDAMSRKIAGIDEQPSAPPAFKDAAGAAVDLFAEDATEKLPVMIGTAGADHVTPTPTPRDLIGHIEYLRAEQFPDTAIREMFDENRSYTRQEHDMAKARLAEFTSDPEFGRRLFAGGFRERYLLNCACRILSGGLKAA